MPGKVKRVDFTRKSRWLRLLFFAFVIYFAVIIINQQITLGNLRQRRHNIREEIDELEKANEQLRTYIELLQTDPDYIEGIVRRELGLVREGEIIYILPQRDPVK
ncbi:MAG: septum formation initiator family protein [Firmicutes bacterium]|nr:septum formation initiator family protein [Bacillota bacterium]HOB35607.1 septum formation initiator family protein [Bacillota bacterium]HPZ91309.1 septum formation initiator family protein [Bacillota bacterium]HQE02423.1 septum formation initiator family protein [Bacillota bacterium]